MAQGRGRFFGYFICNNTNTNLNKNSHTHLTYQSFKPFFLFFPISARSSLKKFENEKWPKAGYLPLLGAVILSRISDTLSRKKY